MLLRLFFLAALCSLSLALPVRGSNEVTKKEMDDMIAKSDYGNILFPPDEDGWTPHPLGTPLSSTYSEKGSTIPVRPLPDGPATRNNPQAVPPRAVSPLSLSGRLPSVSAASSSQNLSSFVNRTPQGRQTDPSSRPVVASSSQNPSSYVDRTHRHRPKMHPYLRPLSPQPWGVANTHTNLGPGPYLVAASSSRDPSGKRIATHPLAPGLAPGTPSLQEPSSSANRMPPSHPYVRPPSLQTPSKWDMIRVKWTENNVVKAGDYLLMNWSQRMFMTFPIVTEVTTEVTMDKTIEIQENPRLWIIKAVVPLARENIMNCEIIGTVTEESFRTEVDDHWEEEGWP